MEKEFIPYEQALTLKQLGFEEECFAQYSDKALCQHGYGKVRQGNLLSYNCITPLYQQCFRWFREKYGYDVTIKKCTPSEYKFEIEQLFVEGNNYYFIDFSFNTYEEAEVECLKKLIEIVKEK
jgi:hypothetical protein